MNGSLAIVVTTFNRRDIVARCVASCLTQERLADEVIIVDDGSTDDTVAFLRGRFGDRIDVVEHAVNRGINPARRTGVEHARSDWICVVDSDWELLPGAVARLRELIEGLPPDVRAVRARLAWDNGHVSPSFMPDGIVGYRERIQWAEAEGGFDSLTCMHRTAFAEVPYIADRRGTVEELYELDLAARVESVYCNDVLGRQYLDAPNSYLRTVDRRVLIPQLLRDAPDLLWMAETVLARHGQALRVDGPRQYEVILRLAAAKAFLSGQRRRGLRHAGRLLHRQPANAMTWVTCLVGLLGRRPLAYATLGFRLARGRRAGAEA